MMRQEATMQVLEATLASGALLEPPAGTEPSGRKWRVRIFEYGLSKNRYPAPPEFGNRDAGPGNPEPQTPEHASRLPLRWTERSARAALRHLEGARCFADHAEGAAGGRSVRDLVGYFSEPALGPRGPEATLRLLESESWARHKLLGAWRAGRLELIGFSIDAVVQVRPSGRALEVEDILSIQSVDMVCAASSGGRALEVLESREAEGRSRDSETQLPRPPAAPGTGANKDGAGNHSRGDTMKQAIERMLEALPPAAEGLKGEAEAASRQLRERLEAALAASEIHPEQVLAALADWLVAVRDSGLGTRDWGNGSPKKEPRTGNAELAGVREQVRSLRQQIADAVRRQRIAEHRLRLDEKLAAARLPKPLAELVASRFHSDGPFGGREFTEEAVEMEIQRVREAYAALSPVGRVTESGRAQVVREPEEKLQMALDRLFNLPVEDPSIPAFHGIREAYVAYTGDGEVTGLLPSRMRIREDITSTTFPNALGNTLWRL
ncbi:MAG TPA: hypothetical protein VNN17_10870, partial [Terriglobia bacterium]|nr:hypothetical protein [Terriglobia bacterium]